MRSKAEQRPDMATAGSMTSRRTSPGAQRILAWGLLVVLLGVAIAAVIIKVRDELAVRADAEGRPAADCRGEVRGSLRCRSIAG